MNDGMKVEIVIHKNQANKDVVWKYHHVIKDQIISESDDKIMISVPTDWRGFRNGLATTLMKELGKDIFLALAYFSYDEGEEVYDFEGNRMEGFLDSADNIPGRKYVKKRLMIVNKVNKENSYITFKAFVFNIKYSEPVLKILDVSCVGEEGMRQLTRLGGWAKEIMDRV